MDANHDSNEAELKLLHVGFNQDTSCFSVTTSEGFQVHNTDPYTERFRRDFSSLTISYVEMLFGSNIFALVVDEGGSESDQQYHVNNKVIIWDDHKESNCIVAQLSYRSEVKAVKLRRDQIVVVLEHKIYVYKLSDTKLISRQTEFETFTNPRGLCEVSHAADSFVMVCPGMTKGQIRIEHYATRRTKFVSAHNSGVACLALTLDGQLIATASSKGTLVRIFKAAYGSLLREVRRGADRADIYSLAFSSNAQWLAVSSDKGTGHVFDVLVGSNDQKTGFESHGIGASVTFIKAMLPKYF